MPTISLSPRFFKTEISNYSNWMRAWIREVIQNSVDAGTPFINIDISPDKTVTVTDSGKGMDEETFLNKFLTLGGTGKEGADTVGGFGKAKILLCFAQDSYVFSSQDWICEGVGSDFEIVKQNHSPFTTVSAKLDAPHHSVERIKEIFAAFISKVNFNGSIKLNGEEIKHGYDKGRWVRDLSFARVFYNKTGEINSTIVSVCGIPMFERAALVKGTLTIDLVPSCSREVLNSNRDSLQYKQSDELNEFITELATEKEYALKPKSKKSFKLFGKLTRFVKKGARQVERYVSEVMTESERKVALATYSAQLGTRFEQAEVDCLVNLAINNESESEETLKVIKTWTPDYWLRYNTGGDKIKLFKIWNEAINISLEIFSNKRSTDFNFATGWVFDDGDIAAQCRCVNSDYYFLLNPIGKDLKMKYSINNRADLFTILMNASHEVAHVASMSHDVDFAYMRDYLMNQILRNDRENINRLKEAKDS